MRATHTLLATLLASSLAAPFMAFAAPADAGKSEASKEKEARHARIYNEAPSEARVACRGLAPAAACRYVVPANQVRGYDQKVEGSCWAPENSMKLPSVCR